MYRLKVKGPGGRGGGGGASLAYTECVHTLCPRPQHSKKLNAHSATHPLHAPGECLLHCADDEQESAQ